MEQDISQLRKNYSAKELNEADINPDPIIQFGQWFREAMDCKETEPNAMALATADAQGKPSCRIVLLKEFNQEGFVFFTNYKSHKGQDLDSNPNAAFTIFWHGLERQVRVEGKVEKVSTADSDEYFSTRPVGSKLGAWASPQSQPIEKAELIQKEKDMETQYAGKEVPRPAHWGGYRVIPEMIEFWQGRPNRLHDRIVYQKKETGWHIGRIAP